MYDNNSRYKGYTCRDLNIYLDTLHAVKPCLISTVKIIILVYLLSIFGYVYQNGFYQLSVNLFTFAVYFIYSVSSCILFIWSIATIYVMLPLDFLWFTFPFYSRLQFYRVTKRVCTPNEQDKDLDSFIRDFDFMRIVISKTTIYVYDSKNQPRAKRYLQTIIDLQAHIESIKNLNKPSELRLSYAEMKYLVDCCIAGTSDS